MSMELPSFQTFPGRRQGLKSPLNVLVGLFNQHAMVIFLKLKKRKHSVFVFSFVIPKRRLKNQ